MILPGGAVAVVVVCFIFCPLALLALAARLWSRRIMKLKLSSNDFFAILATVLVVGTTSVFLAASFAAGLGVHLKDVPPDELAIHLKLFVPAQLLWGAANTCVKLSILDLYIKVFPNPTFRRSCYCTIVLSVCYFLSVLLETFLLCRPISYNWDKSVPGGSCADMNLAYLLAGITNLIIDALVVILPMPMLWRLHLPMAKKMGLAGMFGLGSLICVITLLRVLWLKNWDITDLTYTVTPGACWSVLEPALGVVNACLPTMRPVLHKVFNYDTRAWSKPSHKHSILAGGWKQNHSGPYSFPSDSDRNSFLRLKDFQVSSTEPQTSADHPVAPDDRMNLAKPASNAIQVTRSWDVETVENGTHQV